MILRQFQFTEVTKLKPDIACDLKKILVMSFCHLCTCKATERQMVPTGVIYMRLLTLPLLCIFKCRLSGNFIFNSIYFRFAKDTHGDPTYIKDVPEG